MAAEVRTGFASFGSGPSARRYWIWHADPLAQPQSVIVHVHAFAEEMNKARRMVALQARALAARGHSVLLMDLLGCGDSDGDFGEATWEAWLDDVVGACAFARDQVSRAWPGAHPPLWLWTVRAGSLVARDALPRLPAVGGMVCWQPALQGRQVLQSFLRLHAVASALGRGAAQSERTHAPKELLDRGESVEVAGYRIAPRLTQGLEASKFEPNGLPNTLRIEWFEISTASPPTVSPASQAAIDRWQQHGHAVSVHLVEGPPFWQTVEVEIAGDLIDPTVRALEDDPRGAR